MESPAENSSDVEWEEEEAPSLADLPLAYDNSSPEYLQQKPPSVTPWMRRLKAYRAPKASESHDFEFSSANSTPNSQKNRYSDDLCPADKLFYKGQLLPLTWEYSSDSSCPARQDSQSSNSSSGSTSQTSNGSSKSGDSAAENPTRPLLLRRGIPRVSSQKRSSWQYLARGLLSSPENPLSSAATLRSGKSRVRFPQEDCKNPTNPNAVQEFPSVKRREERSTGWRRLTTIFSSGHGCKGTNAVLAGAHRSKPKDSNSQIGRFNAVEE